MGYIIFSGNHSIPCNPVELNSWEHYFSGLMQNYTVMSENGGLKKVTFSKMNIQELNKKVDRIKKQLDYLDSNKNISVSERDDLRKYYQEQLQKYETLRNANKDS